MGLFKTIPKLRAAVDDENRMRDAALIGLPDRIGPFTVRLMTLEDYITLRLIRNPFVVGGLPSSEAVNEFLKRMMLDAGWLARQQRVRLCRRLRFPSRPLLRTPKSTRKWVKLCKRTVRRLRIISRLIEAYVAESIQDWPSEREWLAEEISVYGIGVSFCSVMLREYDWPFEKTLKTPLKVLMQCFKEVQQSKGRRVFNSRSRDIINDWLLERNRN